MDTYNESVEQRTLPERLITAANSISTKVGQDVKAFAHLAESAGQTISDNLTLIEQGLTKGKVSPRDYRQQKAIAAVPGGLTSAKPKRRRSNSYQTMLDDSLNNRAIALAEESESRMSLTTRLIIAGIESLEARRG